MEDGFETKASPWDLHRLLLKKVGLLGEDCIAQPSLKSCIVRVKIIQRIYLVTKRTVWYIEMGYKMLRFHLGLVYPGGWYGNRKLIWI